MKFQLHNGQVETGMVMLDGRASFTTDEALTFLADSVTNRQRRSRTLGFDRKRVSLDEVREKLLRHGTTRYRLRAPYSFASVADLCCDVEIVRSYGFYTIHCSGNYPEGAVKQANARQRVRESKPATSVATLMQAATRRRKNPVRVERRIKRRQLRELRRKAANAARASAPKVMRRPKAAAFTLARNLPQKKAVVVPQFKNQRFFFKEAVETLVAVFNIKDDAARKRTAYEAVDRELRRSMKVLKQGALAAGRGTSIAIFKRDGFTFRIDIADGGAFRGELTPVTISATKDNADPRYRKMRSHLSALTLGLDLFAQRIRHRMLWAEEFQQALAA